MDLHQAFDRIGWERFDLEKRVQDKHFVGLLIDAFHLFDGQGPEARLNRDTKCVYPEGDRMKLLVVQLVHEILYPNKLAAWQGILSRISKAAAPDMGDGYVLDDRLGTSV